MCGVRKLHILSDDLSGEDAYETDNANYLEENKEAFNINAYDSISWTYNGENTVSDQEKQVDYYIKGAQITGWEDVYSDETKFVENDGIYTLTVELTEGDEFMFTSMVTVGDTSSVGTEYIRYTNIAEDDSESLSLSPERTVPILWQDRPEAIRLPMIRQPRCLR